jgi:hypothetical protein
MQMVRGFAANGAGSEPFADLNCNPGITLRWRFDGEGLGLPVHQLQDKYIVIVRPRLQPLGVIPITF